MVCCAALNCRNATSGTYKNNAVTFFGFPLQDEALLQRWIRNMGRDMETPSKYQRLCSAHFEESSFQREPLKVHKRRLLKEAVPSKFLLGADGNWLVGTPQSCSGIISNRSRKRIRMAEHWRVSGKFPYGAERPTLEDWQNEFYKTILKKNCGSLTTVGKDYPIPKAKILMGEAAQVKVQQDLKGRKIPASLGTGHGVAKIRYQLQSGEVHGSPSGGSQNLCQNLSGKGEALESLGTGHGVAKIRYQLQSGEVRGSPSGGSQNLHQNLSVKGETSGSPQNPTNHPNPLGKARSSSSSPAGGQAEFRQFLLSQQSRAQAPDTPWFICTDCGKSFARHAYVRRHQKIHSGLRPHRCPLCRKSFLEKPSFTDHLRTHLYIIQLPSAFLG